MQVESYFVDGWVSVCCLRRKEREPGCMWKEGKLAGVVCEAQGNVLLENLGSLHLCEKLDLPFSKITHHGRLQKLKMTTCS